jgi:hypothetical protein
MRGSRSTPAAPPEQGLTLQRQGRSAPFQSLPSWASRSWRSAVSCSSHEASQATTNWSRLLWPVNNSAGASKELSPTRAHRLTGSGSSLSWQRSLRPPPASPGDRVCRREPHSASCASTALAEPAPTGEPSGWCCRLLRDRGSKQGRYLVVDRHCSGFRHAVVGVAVGTAVSPGDRLAQSALSPSVGHARPALPGPTRRLAVVVKGGGSHQSATR